MGISLVLAPFPQKRGQHSLHFYPDRSVHLILRILASKKDTPGFLGYLVGGFKYCLFSPLLGEMIQFDYCNIFQMG